MGPQLLRLTGQLADLVRQPLRRTHELEGVDVVVSRIITHRSPAIRLDQSGLTLPQLHMEGQRLARSRAHVLSGCRVFGAQPVELRPRLAPAVINVREDDGHTRLIAVTAPVFGARESGSCVNDRHGPHIRSSLLGQV